jgi:hypothetical protein
MAVTLLRNRVGLLVPLLAASSLHLIAFAEPLPETATVAPTDITPETLAYDEIVARIPHTEAPIASVALSKVNIALHNAKQIAEQRLCSGEWVPPGEVSNQHGPIMEKQQGDVPGETFWIYSLSMRPQHIACGKTTRTRFFLEMSRHLPDWISIRPAGQITAFRNGEIVFLGQGAVAAR